MPKRIKDYGTAATTIATDDYFAIDGVTNGTRKALLTAVGNTGLLFGAGTAGAPLMAVGTAGNGVYAPSGNTLGFSTNGLGRWKIDSFGTLVSDVQSTPVLRFQPSLPGTICGVEWFDTGAVLAAYAKYNVTSPQLEINAGKSGSTGRIVFYTNTTDVGRFTSAGSLLVGTNSETGLTGAGGFRVASTTSAVSSVAGAVVVGDLTAATTVAIGGGNVNAGANLIAAGSVGAGTSSPSFAVEVSGTASLAKRTIGINAVPLIYLPDQAVFPYSLALSNGLRNLSWTAAVEGQNNTAVGIGVLTLNSRGFFNTALGALAMADNTIGNYNTALGEGALQHNDSGISNTAVGTSALNNTTANYNTGVGLDALQYNTTGTENVAVGKRAAWQKVTGSNNTVVGTDALYSSLAGASNTAIGHNSLNASTADNNTAVGASSLVANVTGTLNAAIGRAAFLNLTTGSSNTALGDSAGRYHADGSTALITSANSIYIGADARGFNNSDNNSIVIGAGASGIGANSVVLGGTGIATTVLRGNVGINITSPGALLQVFSNADFTTESGTMIVGSTNSGKQALTFGVNTTSTYSYIQSTQWSTAYRALSLNPLGGNVGINTTAPDKALEINSATGANLRLTYNDSNGGALNYADFSMSSGGKLTIAPSGGVVSITGGLGTSVQSLSGAGAVNLTTGITEVTSTGVANALMLADGAPGQEKTIIHGVDGGSFVLTPTTKTGWSTFTSTAAGESITLVFLTTRGWIVKGSYLGVIAP